MNTRQIVILAVAIAPFCCGPAAADIVGTGGAATLLAAPPPSVVPGALQSNVTMFAFNEQQNIVLPAAVLADITALPGAVPGPGAVSPGPIAAGTAVDVHLVHFDQLGPGVTSLTGIVVFAEEIIGIIVRDGSLDLSDPLGTAGAYPTGVPRRGVDWDILPHEFINVLPDLRTLEVTLTTSNVIDQVRVITKAGEGDETPPYVWEFSLDIGSDKELSDPFADGDEGADPGDVYFSTEGPFTPPVFPCGRDGLKDDLFIFGFDVFPSPPDCGMPPATRVPVGANCPPTQCFMDYFDLDGHDQIDVDLRQFFDSPFQPLPQPMPRPIFGQTNCIYRPHHLMISYDDDRAPSWPAADVPVTMPSAAGVSSHGSTAARDEIVGLEVTPGAAPPFPITLVYPIADESEVHPDLAPNPDGVEQEDDDVDSLDIVPPGDPDEPGGPGQVCPYWYFTADHEAVSPLFLDPGGIYLVVGGGAPVQVIDEVQLGIPESVDIDAFEFVWLLSTGGTEVFGVIYSVDNDDPLTAPDESGGMNPAQVYGSFLTGFSFPLFNPNHPALYDDIDAITAWGESLVPDCDCPGDMNNDGVLNGLDIQLFTDCLLGVAAAADCICADIDGDGINNMNDVLPFVTSLLNNVACP